jgi:hypothetical protein
MRLSRALQKAGVTFWRKMAGYYDLGHLEFSSNRLYQALLKSLRDPEVIGKAMEELPEIDTKLLKAVVLAQSSGSNYDMRHWKKYSAYLKPSNNDPFENLKDRGIVYLNEEEIYVPLEISNAVIEVLKTSAAKYDYIDEDIIFSSGGVKAVGDLLRFLDIVRKEEIRVTQANQLYKRDQEVFNIRLDIDESHKLNVGTRLDFLFEATQALELTSVVEGDLMLSETIDDWFKNPAKDIWKSIYSFWTTQYPESAEPRVSQQVIVGLITKLLNENVIKKDDLKRLYEDFGGIVPAHPENDDWWSNIINELVYLGILRSGEYQGSSALKLNTEIVKLISDPEFEWMEEDTFMLENDYQIIVSPYIKPGILWKLSEMTADEGSNAAYSYKITKSSIYHALLQGRKIEEIIEFFKNHSKTGLPKNIEESISSWSLRFGQIFFLDACLLCCKKSSLVNEIMNVPEMEQYIMGKVNDNVLLVKREDYEKLLVELENHGYMPYKDLYIADNMPFSPIEKGGN